ncbi:hypothetical protein BDE02_01G254900 [Populus trichocarpa]|nr:hypothetical protein BDE02_01G254900 [Populus trichocarpa]
MREGYGLCLQLAYLYWSIAASNTSLLVFQGHPTLVPNKKVDAKQLLSFFGSHREDFNFSSPLQSQIYVQNYLSVEKDLTEFADSLLVYPDEYGTENAALYLPNDHSLPRSSRKAYAEDSSDRTTYHAYREVINNLQ